MDEELLNADRGDNYTPPAEATPTPPAATEAKTETPAANTDADDKDEKQEQPRDAGGKFAKREREDEDGEARIPKSRFDEQVAKERQRAEALERRLAEMEAQLQKTAKVEEQTKATEVIETELDGLYEKQADLLADGKPKEAAAVAKEIRAKERELARMEIMGKTEALTEEKIAVKTEEQRIDAVVNELQAQYDVLDEKSDSYDPRLVNFILAEQGRLIQQERLSPSAALKRAGEETMALFKHTPKGAKAEVPAPKEDKGAERRADALKKNLDAAKAQPASLKEVGMDSDSAGAKKVELDPNKLSYNEFNKLPDDVVRRMRGDFVE